MAKKRTSLDTLLGTEVKEVSISVTENKSPKKQTSKREVQSEIKKQAQQDKLQETSTDTKIIRQTVYLPKNVHEQLRQLAFEERKKMHDYLVEGLNRVFKNRGLKSFDDLK